MTIKNERWLPVVGYDGLSEEKMLQPTKTGFVKYERGDVHEF